jgi:phosphatidylglycerophosphatase GEP4
MPQFFNLNAILSFSHALRNRQLLVPSLSCGSVRSVPFAELKSSGYTGVIFDKDNTLTLPYSDELPEESKVATVCSGAFSA